MAAVTALLWVGSGLEEYDTRMFADLSAMIRGGLAPSPVFTQICRALEAALVE
jgi:hypothetical protein